MRFGFREMIFVLLVLAVPVGTYYGYFQGANSDIAQAREEIQKKQAKLGELEKATDRMSDLGKEIDSLGQAIQVVERQLPAQQQMEVILKEVWELASKHHVSPRSVRTDKIVPAAQYATLPIRMKIVGNFDGFYQFLLAVERLPRITRMPTMHLQRLRAKDGQDGKMKADVVLKIFFEGKHAQDDDDSNHQSA